MITDKLSFDMERGQVGIGTLIIFIAMVLVAAVAAGVLINTSGMLESQASTTADDTQDQVTNNVEFVSANGQVTNDSGNIGVSAIELTVMKGAGADSISIDDATLVFSSSDQSETLLLDGSDSAITKSMVKGTDTSVLQGQDERLQIAVDTTEIYGNTVGMSEGSSATVTFVDQSGAESIYGVNVPDTLTDDLTYVQV